jgi:hypothetical protein
VAKRSFVLGCLVGSSLTANVLLSVPLRAHRSVVQADTGRDGAMAPVPLAATEPQRARDTLLTRAEPAAGQDEPERCPATGKTGHSTLSLEEVMKRVHGDARGGHCPYADQPRSDRQQCPHLRARGASGRQTGDILL